MKSRLDTYLVENGWFETKNKAQAMILAGEVKVNGETIRKSGTMIDFTPQTKIEIKTMPFVSRGGFKLEKAINTFEINLKERICIDCGASTGGFTDCMLQNGAKKVYAVDVGYGQLDWKIRNDNRVKVVERTNIKNCTPEAIYSPENELPDFELPDFCAMDLSFISIKKVLNNVKRLVKPNCEFVILIKPQFEAEKNKIEKGGVVKSKEVHEQIKEDIENFCASCRIDVSAIIDSPIKGAKEGNKEFLLYGVSRL